VHATRRAAATLRLTRVSNAQAGVTHYFASEALLAEGWAKNVAIDVDQAGSILSISRDALQQPGMEICRGPLLPGMPNLHSHAFQRAMAGLTERSGPAGDSFWSWREQMYHFLEVLGPDEMQAIATMLYIEMLEAGYTSVAEFHYLHHAPDGQAYSDRAEMGQRIINAAGQCGIGLTLLPVMYCQGGFNRQSASAGQRRFINSLDQFVPLVDQLVSRLLPGMRIGVAPHSLRAVDPDDVLRLRQQLVHLGPDAPWHMHVAEQQQEVTECIEATGARPVQWLLDHAGLDRHWCLVHATHMSSEETIGLAGSGAVAGLCPSTEADLGDGFFDAQRFLSAGGSFGLGGDSHVAIDPFFELRLFEYGQRLLRQRRNLLGGESGRSVGGALYRRALAGGAAALAQPVGKLAVGARADWIVLDCGRPSLVARHGDDLLDSAIFAPSSAHVRDVMVAGQWRVRDKTHHLRASAEARYQEVLMRLVRNR
jgi:formimidoylglutamate deiminase